MTTSPITAKAGTSSAATTTTTTSTPDVPSNPSSALNQNDFLKLLVAQIQYQDPMNPQSNTDMAAQLAQFTALQQATQSTSSLAMIQANSLVGNTVTVQVDSKTSASGVVTGVVFNNGTPQITIKSTDASGNVTTKNYNLSQVTSVIPTPVATPAAATTGTTTGTTSSTTQTNQ
jgi:flagellar basal-body rod modification protein FlgD